MECRLDGITIHYEERGEGRPLVALHGMPLDHRAMMADLEPLFRKRKGWRRIYPDLPGMGGTEGPDWITRQDEVLDVLVQFVESVLPGQRFSVAGSSYGGLLAQALVHRLGERIDGALLIVPSMGSKESRDLPARRVLFEGAVDFSGLSPQAEASFRSMAVVQTQDQLEAWKEWIFPCLDAADREFVGRLEKHYALSFDVARLPRPFDRPTLFLVGRQDHVCGYRDAWRALESYPRATFAVLDRAGHCLGPGMEQSALYEALAGEWLDRVEGEATGA